MSLTSRLVNLLTSESSSQLATVGGSEHDANREDGTEFAIPRTLKRMRTMAKTEADDDFELKRPPYLHVGLPTSNILYQNTNFINSLCWPEELGARAVIC
jgi:hypothetical protein